MDARTLCSLVASLASLSLTTPLKCSYCCYYSTLMNLTSSHDVVDDDMPGYCLLPGHQLLESDTALPASPSTNRPSAQRDRHNTHNKSWPLRCCKPLKEVNQPLEIFWIPFFIHLQMHLFNNLLRYFVILILLIKNKLFKYKLNTLKIILNANKNKHE